MRSVKATQPLVGLIDRDMRLERSESSVRLVKESPLLMVSERLGPLLSRFENIGLPERSTGTSFRSIVM